MRGMIETKESRWRALVAEQEGSGQTVREFAAARGIKWRTLYRWRSRLQCDGDGFVSVAVVGDASAADTASPVRAAFELRIDTGVTLRVPSGFDEGELRRLLQVLRC
jgi:transposase-like protein